MSETKKDEAVKEFEYFNPTTKEKIEVSDTQKVLRLKSKEFENKTKKLKFMTFKAVERNGNLMECKFTKDANNTPKTEGYHHVLIEKENMNIDSHTKDWRVLWVKDVVMIVTKADFRAEEKAKEIDEVF